MKPIQVKINDKFRYFLKIGTIVQSNKQKQNPSVLDEG